MILIYAIYKAGENLPDVQAAMRPSLPRISCLASNSDSLYPTGGESLPLVRTSLRPTPSAGLKRRPATPCSNLSASAIKV